MNHGVWCRELGHECLGHRVYIIYVCVDMYLIGHSHDVTQCRTAPPMKGQRQFTLPTNRKRLVTWDLKIWEVCLLMLPAFGKGQCTLVVSFDDWRAKRGHLTAGPDKDRPVPSGLHCRPWTVPRVCQHSERHRGVCGEFETRRWIELSLPPNIVLTQRECR